MLRIYPVVLETLTSLRGLIAQIERRDSDLGRQLRRAAASIVRVHPVKQRMGRSLGTHTRGEVSPDAPNRKPKVPP